MSHASSAPVRFIPGDEKRSVEKGIALCLSGGGYRAMLFHLGSLWRLNELGLFPKLARISSVSGGSITAACMGLHWNALIFNRRGMAENFQTEIVEPLRAMSRVQIDIPDIVKGLMLPGTISEYIASSYAKILFGHATLQDLPDPKRAPEFIINATHVQTSTLWRFSREQMANYRVGRIKRPTLSLATAVAASSAFPPFLSPTVLKLNPKHIVRDPSCDLQYEPYTTQAVLCDGGIYDNLGLETCWKKYRTILASDACGPLSPEERPKRDWPLQAYRLLFMVQNEVQILRKRQLIDSYKQKQRAGAYWGIASNISDYELRDCLPVPLKWSSELAHTPTRLATLSESLQEQLINWGYAITDAALRKHVLLRKSDVKPPAFPYPRHAPSSSRVKISKTRRASS